MNPSIYISYLKMCFFMLFEQFFCTLVYIGIETDVIFAFRDQTLRLLHVRHEIFPKIPSSATQPHSYGYESFFTHCNCNYFHLFVCFFKSWSCACLSVLQLSALLIIYGACGSFVAYMSFDSLALLAC